MRIRFFHRSAPYRLTLCLLVCWGCRASDTARPVPAAAPQEPLSWGAMQAALARRVDQVGPPPEQISYGEAPDQYGELTLPGGAWPGILEDVAAGADHARTLAQRYPLDLTRVVTLGHSSGGHLALWLAGRSALPPDAPGAVGLAAIADLRHYTRCGPTIVPDFLGVAMDEAQDHLRLADPGSMPPYLTPQLLVMGALDPIVPPAQGAHYREQANRRGGRVRMYTVQTAGHFELVAPWTAAWPDIWRALRGFLDSYTG